MRWNERGVENKRKAIWLARRRDGARQDPSRWENDANEREGEVSRCKRIIAKTTLKPRPSLFVGLNNTQACSFLFTFARSYASHRAQMQACDKYLQIDSYNESTWRVKFSLSTAISKMWLSYKIIFIKRIVANVDKISTLWSSVYRLLTGGRYLLAVSLKKNKRIKRLINQLNFSC